MNRGRVLDRNLILKTIQDNLDSTYQWSQQFAEKRINPDYSETAFGYMHRAEALIELLEVADCGSVGGFDQGEEGLYSLEERFKLLKRKKPEQAGLKKWTK